MGSIIRKKIDNLGGPKETKLERDISCEEIKEIFKNLRAWRSTYQDFMDYEKNCMTDMRKLGYTRSEMFIIYCKAFLNWGRKTIVKNSQGKVSEYCCNKAFRKLKKGGGYIPKVKHKAQI